MCFELFLPPRSLDGEERTGQRTKAWEFGIILARLGCAMLGGVFFFVRAAGQAGAPAAAAAPGKRADRKPATVCSSRPPPLVSRELEAVCTYICSGIAESGFPAPPWPSEADDSIPDAGRVCVRFYGI